MPTRDIGSFYEFCLTIAGRLHGNRAPLHNIFDADINATDTSLSLAYPTNGLAYGTPIAIGLERMTVRDVDSSSYTLTISRDFDPTYNAAHTVAADPLVQISWEWWLRDIFDACMDELESWPADLYDRADTTVSFTASAIQADVTWTRFKSILHAWYEDACGEYHPLPNAQFRPESGGSSTGSFFLGRSALGRATTVNVTYAQGRDLSAIDFYTTEVDSVIQASWVDILRYGVLWRLMSERQASRLSDSVQKPSEDSRVIASTARIQTALGWKELRDSRIAEETARLKRNDAYSWRFR